MDLFGRFKKLDSSLQRGLDNGFARVFGGEVVPTEIDELLKQQAEESMMIDSRGQKLAPSYFHVQVSERDHDSLTEDRPRLNEDLSDRLSRFIRNQGWHSNGPIRVDVTATDSLHSGQLRVDARFNAPKDKQVESQEQPRSRPDGSYADSYPGQRVEPVADDRPSWPQRDGEDRSSSAKDYDAHSSLGATSLQASSPSPSASEHAGLAGLVRPGGVNDVADQHGAGTSAPAEPARHPGESAYAAEEPAKDPTNNEAGSPANEPANDPAHKPEPKPMSYPGTEVIAQSMPQPVRGGTGEPGAEEEMSVTLYLRDGSDRSYRLQQGSNIIGRGNGVDLRIPDTGVSRQHADIAWDGFDAVLTDLKSTNGTTVNEIPVENWLLADGDVISLGHSEIEVRFN
ncbi:MAG TPA: DUF3662 and FHA domain-containing protein [Candidatus Corynebacterium gallistercoris]|uniref:DUF3662 and FHA domain-containing protein n=1 Tax=Candidatus Corynebacterium gallistercoris TaxID=2838530 RepID=A0A9D1RVT3_9CORY|nr:DUF3662 and FHA domain-containing protein [Candidatus Corynebacterium gallistercoris]